MSNFLHRRLAKLAPPALPGATFTVPPTDPQVLADMRDYLDGKRVLVPGVSPEVQRAMDDFLAVNV